ncbi:nitrite reductase [NAD(P)H], large subunit [Kwoniella bestiolae CBS 10118]|uniref:Nitrite reductase [NAD(P)H] n=1 Tax=Kwoniella bestiolae CBS 10118 TaxID=1296100 RepID=A0A1B9GF28_9TREE|nr:nitrite reductase [NAD(P)H], large subunit [Kwoniella bestiolae CBS 10118]OCF29596.1 nitrite reductase [NAD(P)H], large subunit [Kwoniella bestiolae CBS 10118]
MDSASGTSGSSKPPAERIQVMVVGLGMVGIAFIEKMLTLDVAGKYFIRTCGEEPVVAYNRVGLTEYFQHRNIEDLYLNDVSWYAKQNPEHFAFHIGEQVTHIDSENKVVKTSKSNEFKYDILVLATGSVASLPPYMTTERAKTVKGVFVYRSIADLEAIIKYGERPEVKRASVIGGGLLGLEAAKAVYDMKVPEVSILIRQDYPLNRQLDSSAGELVLKKIEKMGVEVKTRCEPSSILTRTDDQGDETFEGFNVKDEKIESDMVIFAIGIQPRDDLARSSGIEIEPKGGIKVGDDLQTSAKGVYAIGECASWRGNFYGLIAPGVEMADILAFNLTQTEGTAAHVPRSMNPPDLSTRLKLMGVDVASFGDYFADIRVAQKPKADPVADGEVAISQPKPSKHRKLAADGPIQCLTYHDPFSATYKKYIFTEDGQHLLGGMMIGDVGDFTKLVAITKKKKKLGVPPSDFILGAKKAGEDDGGDLDDDAVVCSCHNVTKGAIGSCVKSGLTDLAAVKTKTKAGAGCGGCVPMVTNIFKAEMKKSGHKVSTALCPHFKMSRQDLFQIIKIKKLRDFATINETVGTPGTIGCEICKPAVASILSSLYNEHVMKVEHHHNQDTNDRFLANIQRNGTFSVVPRIPGGEISPEKLVAIGKIASEYGLYTKITGGQRIDLFGASKPDLPDIWAKLHAAGLESGHAYGKSLRTVKSCVGTTWCRFGVGDSVGLAIDLENRYRGVRSPHKFKGGVSGCVRECAEAQSKDFGLIATDKGWNIFVGGNGGMKPRHAQLFAQDVPPSKVVRIIDRYLMYYIRTADRLVRTAPWLESLEGGIEKLRKVILEDELGICADLDAEMDNLIGTYEDEWKKAVEDPEARKRFRQFVNTDERRPAIDIIEERGQKRAADWPRDFPSQKFDGSHLMTPESEWKWVSLAGVDDLQVNDQNTTSVAVRYGSDTQLAIFHVPHKGFYATQQMCPHKRAFVLDHGIVGDDKNGDLYVSCPLHKRNFKLDNGDCTNDESLKILTFQARLGEDGQSVQVKLPPAEDLDSVIGSSKWMVKKATAEAFGRNAATAIEIVEPSGELTGEDNTKSNANAGAGGCASSGCGSSALEW